MSNLTKGYIKNVRTSKVMKFIYNPETFSTSRGVNYSEINSPGSSYPVFQYIGGGAEKISVTLFLANYSSNILSWLDFLDEFLPSEDFDLSLSSPPTLIFAFGTYVKECILLTLDKEYKLFDSNLKPTMVDAQLELKVV